MDLLLPQLPALWVLGRPPRGLPVCGEVPKAQRRGEVRVVYLVYTVERSTSGRQFLELVNPEIDPLALFFSTGSYTSFGDSN